MPSSSLNLKEKLSPEEAAKLVVLLDREVPVSHYAKFINERTGEEVDIEEVKKQRQPKPSSCYEYFLDYSNCHKHVSNVLKQSKRNQTLQLNEPDLKVSSVCNKAYQMYEKCTFQAVPDPGTADRATLKASTLHHFVQDLEYYHTSTLSLEEQVELSVKMLHDPSLQEKFKDLQSKVTYNEEDMAGYKNFVQSEIERQFPLAVGKGSSSSSRRRYKKESDMGQEFPISDELKTLLNKLDN